MKQLIEQTKPKQQSKTEVSFHPGDSKTIRIFGSVFTISSDVFCDDFYGAKPINNSNDIRVNEKVIRRRAKTC